MVVNGGLRYDYINTDAKALVNENTPLGGGQHSSTTADLTTSKTYSRISPRLGVAFPVTDKTVLHVNYGQFYQQPNLQDLYVSYQFLEHKIRTGGYYVGFGNPNLQAGADHGVRGRHRAQMGERPRDRHHGLLQGREGPGRGHDDLVDPEQLRVLPQQGLRHHQGPRRRPRRCGRINHIAGDAELQPVVRRGTGSVSNTQRNIAWTASQPPKQTAPLDFDQRHKMSINLDYAPGQGRGPEVEQHDAARRTRASTCSTTWRAARRSRPRTSTTRSRWPRCQTESGGPDQLDLRAVDPELRLQAHQGLDRWPAPT